MAAIAKVREESRRSMTLGTDLSKRNQLASAVDNFRSAMANNPRLPEARWYLAESEVRLAPKSPASLRDAAEQYRAFLSLSPGLVRKRKGENHQEDHQTGDQSRKNRSQEVERRFRSQPGSAELTLVSLASELIVLTTITFSRGGAIRPFFYVIVSGTQHLAFPLREPALTQGTSKDILTD